jgi:hypothetical protein
VAFFQALAERYSLGWDISWQGINVADNATGADGDITIKEHGDTLLAIEITERPIDRRRIVSTFNTKIILGNVKEYLFVFTKDAPDDTAYQAARSLFSRGYEVNFVNLVELIVNSFLALPASPREIFTDRILTLLEPVEIPSDVKIKWNDSVKNALQI